MVMNIRTDLSDYVPSISISSIGEERSPDYQELGVWCRRSFSSVSGLLYFGVAAKQI